MSGWRNKKLGLLNSPSIFLETRARGEGGLGGNSASIFILPLGRVELHVDICRINFTTHRRIAGMRSGSHLLRTTPQTMLFPTLVFRAWRVHPTVTSQGPRGRGLALRGEAAWTTLPSDPEPPCCSLWGQMGVDLSRELGAREQLQLGVEGQGTHCLELRLISWLGAYFLFPWSFSRRPALASVMIKCTHGFPQPLGLVEQESTSEFLP